MGTEPLSHLTLGQLVDIAAERWGDKEALVSVYQDHRLSFSDARNKVAFIENDCNQCWHLSHTCSTLVISTATNINA
jgi:hypothetical protein